MTHRTVKDLMTDKAVSVQRGTTFKEIVAVLEEFDITAVPVVDDAGRPLGVVSEADLLRKTSGGSSHSALLHPEPGEAERAKVEATTAEGLMTAPAVCARPGWTVVEAAAAMERHRVKRLPVVGDGGELIGVVSRSDLLHVFLRSDQSIRSEIIEDVVVQTLGEPPSAIGVEVGHGHVVLSGTVTRPGLASVLERLCRSVDGVIEVDNRLDAAGGTSSW
ncbi:CBS domain-containing protein [Streptomyces meridianus]|uniref:CBS domain-containing protein n=1 Tax=Streptomyces meridianus TaxID=2938945 RepID=A0ABT0XC51_9ACTN|nr:CBS domain-containing protein [Streptomyces meridianus]MCM2580102.1 CBS domain-containing protein [Streptomyces meridianus]